MLSQTLQFLLSGLTSGAIYALRRACFVPLSADTLVEDLVVPMTARRLGFRVLYDPEARASQATAASLRVAGPGSSPSQARSTYSTRWPRIGQLIGNRM